MDLAHTKKMNRGIATIELLVAFAIIVLSLTAVIVVVFGNQAIALDAELNNLALYKAEEKLERVFADIEAGATTLPSAVAIVDGIFTVDADIVVEEDCYWEISGRTQWTDGGQLQEVLVPTKFVNIPASQALGHDCDTGRSNDPWKNPDTYTSRDIGPPIGPNSGIRGTDIDVTDVAGVPLAFLSSTHNTEAAEDLWVFNVDVAQGVLPVFVDKLDVGTGDGVNAIDIAEVGGDHYLFVAHASTSEQYQIVEITSSGLFGSMVSIDLPGVNPDGSQPEAVAIQYYDGMVYVTTERTDGPEFHIFEFDPLNPLDPSPTSYSLEVNHNLHDIKVSNGDAYIASSAEFCEVIVIDISNPSALTNPCPFPVLPGATVFDAADSGIHPDGTAIDVVGSTIYLGREDAGALRDFYVLDATDLTNITEINSVDLGMSPSIAKVETIEVISSTDASGNPIELAFLGTSDANQEFQVWNVTDPATGLLMCSDFNFPQTVSGIDFFDDKVYASVKSNDALHILFDDP